MIDVTNSFMCIHIYVTQTVQSQSFPSNNVSLKCKLRKGLVLYNAEWFILLVWLIIIIITM